MSYILEALKKAEQANEYGQVPGIDRLHDQAPRRPKRRWRWVLVAALLLNALFVAGLWWQRGSDKSDDTTPTARSAEPVAEGAQGRVLVPSPVASRSDPAARVGTPALRVETDNAGPPAAASTLPPPVIVRQPLRPLPLPDPLPAKTAPLQAKEFPAPAPVPSAVLTVPPDVVQLRAPTPPSPPPAEPAWKRLPLWPLAPEKVRRQVKGRLVMNAHVYSENPEDRFVLVNMKKYREGEQIPEGPNLEEITRDGVILAVPNGRFRLE